MNIDSRDMSSKINSLDEIKEKYLQGIIENYRRIKKKAEPLYTDLERNRDDLTYLKSDYLETESVCCDDKSVGSNSRWGIISKKNLFGLHAVFTPKQKVRTRQNGRFVYREEPEKLQLEGYSGRFQMQKFPVAGAFFTEKIDISDILERPDENRFIELDSFYNMTNREFFECFGACAQNDLERSLMANSVILDSLLKDRYEDVQYIGCSSDGYYSTEIKLSDSTQIILGKDPSTRLSQVMIKKAEKEASVKFNAVNKQKSKDNLTSVIDLDVEDVEYAGDSDLILSLQAAIQEQFVSQNNELENVNICEDYFTIARVLFEKAKRDGNSTIGPYAGEFFAVDDLCVVGIYQDVLGEEHYFIGDGERHVIVNANECTIASPQNMFGEITYGIEANGNIHTIKNDLISDCYCDGEQPTSEDLEFVSKTIEFLKKIKCLAEIEKNKQLIEIAGNAGVTIDDVNKFKQMMIKAESEKSHTVEELGEVEG